MRPVVVFIVSAGGNPTTLKVRESPSGSLAASESDTVAPGAVVWLPGFWRTGGRFGGTIVQVKA